METFIRNSSVSALDNKLIIISVMESSVVSVLWLKPRKDIVKNKKVMDIDNNLV